MSKTRIYTVTNTETKAVRMIRAANKASAIAHVANSLLTCIVTDTESAIANSRRGVEVEVAGEAPSAEPDSE